MWLVLEVVGAQLSNMVPMGLQLPLLELVVVLVLWVPEV
jgi:hypothetical protein|tara:strand:+ start:201 stop:317 length:117 start_codon:yes stop_codon:yes gene_type:complete